MFVVANCIWGEWLAVAIRIVLVVGLLDDAPISILVLLYSIPEIGTVISHLADQNCVKEMSVKTGLFFCTS